jgi:hypothetical protein
MTTKVAWVLLLITAVEVENFEVETVAYYPTMAECYFASTKLFWDELPINQELLCMRVGGHDEE